MIKGKIRTILFFLLSWRIFLFVILFFALEYLPLQENFLGGGFTKYLSNPYFFSWANFDGEHYLSIAQNGYMPRVYSFFPFFPLLIKALPFFGRSLEGYLASGLAISHLSLFIALLGLWKLILLDYKEKVAKLVVLSLLLFPTSFYFGSVYTESLFLALAVWSFYSARRGNFILAGILAGISTSVRVVGLALLPALAVELFVSQKVAKQSFSALALKIASLLIVPLGIFAYMHFLKATTGDSLKFFHEVTIFGEQRTAGFILLPQVFYRYIFKILPSLTTSYFPVLFTTYLEFAVGVLLSVAAVISFFKLRLSYSVFLVVSFLIPTFSGSFSSLPRYALISFPMFILFGLYLSRLKRPAELSLLLFSAILLAIATALFVRGYWVS